MLLIFRHPVIHQFGPGIIVFHKIFPDRILLVDIPVEYHQGSAESSQDQAGDEAAAENSPPARDGFVFSRIEKHQQRNPCRQGSTGRRLGIASQDAADHK